VDSSSLLSTFRGRRGGSNLILLQRTKRAAFRDCSTRSSAGTQANALKRGQGGMQRTNTAAATLRRRSNAAELLLSLKGLRLSMVAVKLAARAEEALNY